MIIGFGSMEKEQQEMVGEKFYEIVSKYIKKGNDIMDYDKFHLEDIEKEIKLFQKEIEEEYDKQDKSSNRPERYFKFRTTAIAQNYETLFIAVSFWHINSRHPFSPDGMSLMQEYKSFSFNYDSYDGLTMF